MLPRAISANLHRIRNLGHRQVRIFHLVWRRILEQDATGMSAALCYRTLFAMIPTLVLAFMVLQSLGVTRDVRADVHRLLGWIGFGQIAVSSEPDTEEGQEDAGAGEQGTSQPATGPSEEQGVERLSEKLEDLIYDVQQKLTIGALKPIGVLLLIWAAVGLLSAVENYLNRIFEATSSRSDLRRLMLYWSVITLVPIGLIAAFGLATGAISWLEQHTGISLVGKVAIYLGPMVVSMLLLALVYTLMPNTRVKFGYAFLAAVLAVPLWTLAEKGFAIYVQRVAKSSIYGTLGLIPLFLIWLNLCWLIFLCAAQYAYVAANLALLERRAAASRLVLGAWDVLAGAIAIARPFQAGRGPVAREAITESLNLSQVEAQVIIDRLCAATIICPVQGTEERYVLSRPAERIPVRDVLLAATAREAIPAVAERKPTTPAGAKPAAPNLARWSAPIAAAVAHVESRTDELLATLTLADVVRESGGQTPPATS